MVMFMTVNDSTTDLERSGWTFMPYNVSVLEARPTAPPVFLWVEPEEAKGPSEIILTGPHDKCLIDQQTHQSLLAQSLREYESIWRDLAER